MSPILLALETSNPSAAGPPPGPSVALRTHSATLLEPLRPAAPNSRGGHDDDLLPAIDRLFKRAALSPKHLKGGAIAVSIGPGGFTGLRIACAAAKMLAESVGAACIAVPTALALARRVDPALFNAGRVGISLASKADTVWLHTFEAPATPHTDGRLITTAEFLAFAATLNIRTLIADRFLPAAMHDAAQQHGISLIPPTYDAAVVLEAAESLPHIDPVDLLPLYPREPEAVTLWRKNKQPHT